jgi:hypothetical protein
MKVKIKIFGKLLEDKETIEIIKRISNFFQIAKIEVEGINYNLFIESEKRTLFISKGDKNDKQNT